MLYMIDGAQAEDDGSAWEYRRSGTGLSRVQVRPLSLTVLQDGLRALSVGTDIVVDAAVARELEQIVPGLDGVERPVTVRGPQPSLLPQPDMVQLGSLATVRLAPPSIERGEDGQVVALKAPFVLSTDGRVPDPTIYKIEENQLTLVSQQVKDLLVAREPRLSFRAVRFEDEAAPEEPPREPFWMPSAEELKKIKGR
jgi:hypothetical protein